MASKKKTFKPKKGTPTPEHAYAAFIGDLLDGTITASKLIESHTNNGHGNDVLTLEYDDPNG